MEIAGEPRADHPVHDLDRLVRPESARPRDREPEQGGDDGHIDALAEKPDASPLNPDFIERARVAPEHLGQLSTSNRRVVGVRDPQRLPGQAPERKPQGNQRSPADQRPGPAELVEDLGRQPDEARDEPDHHGHQHGPGPRLGPRPSSDVEDHTSEPPFHHGDQSLDRLDRSGPTFREAQRQLEQDPERQGPEHPIVWPIQALHDRHLRSAHSDSSVEPRRQDIAPTRVRWSRSPRRNGGFGYNFVPQSQGDRKGNRRNEPQRQQDGSEASRSLMATRSRSFSSGALTAIRRWPRVAMS